MPRTRNRRRHRLGGLVCILLAAASLLVAAASRGSGAALRPEPIAPIPLSSNVDPARAAIGERLFHDVRVSGTRTYSCATCHPLNRGGMDGRAVALIRDGVARDRNTPTVFNASLSATFNWDGVESTLEAHTDRTVKSLMKITWPELISRLRSDRKYVSAFSNAYEEGLTRANVLDAVATFERSLLTPGSRFDRYLLGTRDVLTTREQDGYRLFKLYGCVSCHQGINIGGNMYQRFGVFEAIRPERNGAGDMGRFFVTNAPRDRRVFRVPSLRNVAVTAPYFHDGHAPTLEVAVQTMGRAQLGRRLTRSEIALIVDFLRTLTGEYRGQLLTSARSEAP